MASSGNSGLAGAMVNMGLWPGVPVGGQDTQPHGRAGLSLSVQSQLQAELGDFRGTHGDECDSGIKSMEWWSGTG